MIYFVQPIQGGPIKIGHTTNIKVRMTELQAAYGRRLRLLRTMDGGFQEEQEVHARFAPYRIGKTEQFQPGDDLMDFIGHPRVVDWHVIKDMGHNLDGTERQSKGCGSPTTFRLSRGGHEAIDKVSRQLGMSKAQAVELAMRFFDHTMTNPDPEALSDMIAETRSRGKPEISGMPY